MKYHIVNWGESPDVVIEMGRREAFITGKALSRMRSWTGYDEPLLAALYESFKALEGELRFMVAGKDSP